MDDGDVPLNTIFFECFKEFDDVRWEGNQELKSSLNLSTNSILPAVPM